MDLPVRPFSKMLWILDDGAVDSFEGELRVLPGDGALIHFLFRLL